MESDFYEAALFHIDRERKRHSSMPSRHYHNGYEIFYLVSGDICYFIDDKAYQVVGGVLVIINMNVIHKLVNSSGDSFERITLEFKKEFLEGIFPDNQFIDVLSSFAKGLPLINLSGQDQGFIEKRFDKMIHEYSQKPPGYEFYLKMLLFELLLFIYRKMDSIPDPPLSEVNLVHKKIFEIVDYLNRHYDEQHTIQQISQKFYISPSYFCKTFKENTGFTFTEYLNNVRIKEACTLLTRGNVKVAAIAESVGFESLTHFGRIFKEITGMAPLKYRKNYKV
ncbi:AraC-like DNA-binding protein [Paenibacillus anaericanus]|uniref:AraC family transcriptional regulator n=1 Tax=Paenibacillus anaericanus TaxID=170367 RepID=UPI002785293F|nr:AraC family transcriptional regulator [Paenibacillus anaericanus]MDQ0091534.1 AraC-like DNA-binding protein [Paenibacillus anaericanus]